MGSALFRVCSVWGPLKGPQSRPAPGLPKGHIFIYYLYLLFIILGGARPARRPAVAPTARSSVGGPGVIARRRRRRARCVAAREGRRCAPRAGTIGPHGSSHGALVQPLLRNGPIVARRHRISAIWAHQRDASERRISTVWALARLRSLAHVHRNARWTRREVHGLM